MTDPKQTYTQDVRKHLNESFPNPDSLPHTVNLVAADWFSAITEKCPPPDDLKDADKVVSEVLTEWLSEHGLDLVGEIWVNVKRRDDAAKAEAEAQARKRAAETAPLQALIKDSVMSCLIECGLVEMKPQAKPKPVIKGHRH